MTILEIKNLKKQFGSKTVLDGLTLSVPEHSIFGFIGRNGAGKTTAMKAILGLIKADEGEIYVLGERVTFGQTATNRYVGYLPDVPNFYPFMTPYEYLKLCGESCNMKREDIQTRADELLVLVGLDNDKNRRIKGFSRGMKQRLGIAQALFSRPKLLICDEPTSALDPMGRKEILDILLKAKEETTILFSTHILADVERICTDVALLDGGKIAMQGTVDDLKQSHSGDEFSVEIADNDDRIRVMNAFYDSRISDSGALIFSGGEEEIFSVIEFMHKHKIPFRKIERTETSIESLFLEVIGK